MASGNIESLKVGPHDLVHLEAWSRGVDFGPRGKDFPVSPSLQQGTVTIFLSINVTITFREGFNFLSTFLHESDILDALCKVQKKIKIKLAIWLFLDPSPPPPPVLVKDQIFEFFLTLPLPINIMHVLCSKKVYFT